MAQVRWTPDARDDLASIHRDIAHDSPAAAAALLLRLINAAARLRTFRRPDGLCRNLGAKALREVIVGSYRVVYRLQDEEVQILRVRH